MKRPLIFILIFLALGIYIAYFINNAFFLGLAIVSSICLSIFYYKMYRANIAKYLWVFLLIGIVLININSPKYIHKIENKNAYISGIVSEVKKTNMGDMKFMLSAKYINSHRENNPIKILVYADYNKNIKEGASVKAYGEIIPSNSSGDKNGYDEHTYFIKNKISYKMYANNTVYLKDNKLYSYMYKMKNNISKIYDKILPKNESAILKAMLLGDKSYLTDEIVNIYRNTGIYHILAISGLHIGILCFILTKILGKISKRYSKALTIIILILYCIFTGASLSTIRATIMCITVIAGSIIRKTPDFLSSISFSCILLLIINPYNLFDLGFLYSYTAVFAISLLGGRIVHLYKLKGIKSLIVVSFFVSLAIKPITAYNFYNITLLDVFLNILMLPFMGVIVFTGFLSVIAAIFSINLAEFIIGSTYYILRFFTYVCTVADGIKFNNITVGRPNIIVIIGLYTMLIFIAYSIYEKRLIYKRRKYIDIGIGIFIICLCINFTIKRPFSVTMIDVGQGDSIAGIYKDRAFLVDGGGAINKKTGNKIVLPYLRAKGVKNLDFVFVSHMDSDHIKGVLDIIGNIPISKILVSKMANINTNFINLMKACYENDIELYALDKGDTLRLGNNINFQVFSPNNSAYDDENNNSLVFKLEYKGNKMLFTGDIEKDPENVLLKEDIKTDILKVSHHGSNTSSTDEFIKKLGADVALISAGKNNIYNHPHKETLDTLSKNNIKIYNTADDGSIEIAFYDDGYKIK